MTPSSCCFRNCRLAAQAVDIPVKVWPPSDAPAEMLHAHAGCFENTRSPGVKPDAVHEYGRIPAGARCVMCGRRLPMIGIHPYALEVGEENMADRFWVHARCLETHFIRRED
jgi:hypothetical protein